jgi:hypothetical protein
MRGDPLELGGGHLRRDGLELRDRQQDGRDGAVLEQQCPGEQPSLVLVE